MAGEFEKKAREIALRNVPRANTEWPLSEHTRAVLRGQLQDEVSAALREAVAAEREAAAQRAQEAVATFLAGDASPYIVGGPGSMARAMLAAIRKGSEDA